MKVMLEMFFQTFTMKCYIESTHKMFKKHCDQMFSKHSVKNVFKPIFSECLLNLNLQTYRNKDGGEQ